MKRFAHYFAIAFTVGAMLFASGCNGEEKKEVVRSLKTDKTTLAFAATENEPQTITVTAENVEWKAEVEEAAAEWLKISVADDVITVTAEDNDLEEDRAGKITISDKDGNVESVVVNVSLTALYVPRSLSIDVENLDFEAAGNEPQVITVTSENIEWEVTVDEAAADWLSVAVDGETISVSVTDNDRVHERACAITVSDKGGYVDSVEAGVTQAGAVADLVLVDAVASYYGDGSYRMIFAGGENVTFNKALNLLYVENGKLLRLYNIYTPTPDGFNDLRVAPGRYEFTEDYGEPYTIRTGSFDWSWSGSHMLTYANSASTGTVGVTGGYVYVDIVDGVSQFTIHMTMSDETTYLMYYEGEYIIDDQAPRDYGSRLNGDLDLEITGGHTVIIGDAYGIGLNVWMVYLFNDDIYLRGGATNPFISGDGDVLSIEIYLPTSATEIPDGTYEFNSTQAAGSALSGKPEASGFSGSWYRNFWGALRSKAPLMEGSVKFEKSGTGYKVTLNVVDDHHDGPYKITVDYTGALPMYTGD